MTIRPSKRIKQKSGLATWEVIDNRNQVVGSFSANDKTRARETNLVAQATIRDLSHDLHDLKIKVSDLTASKEWQIKDKASQAAMNLQDAWGELREIIHHLEKEGN